MRHSPASSAQVISRTRRQGRRVAAVILDHDVRAAGQASSPRADAARTARTVPAATVMPRPAAVRSPLTAAGGQQFPIIHIVIMSFRCAGPHGYVGATPVDPSRHPSDIYGRGVSAVLAPPHSLVKVRLGSKESQRGVADIHRSRIS